MHESACKVSVIVPTHNRATVLGATLDAILAQAFDDFEVICVDDSSSDGTPEVLATYGDRIRALRVEHRSPARTRNAGAAMARGELLLFTDDDCAVPEGWIAAMVNRFEHQDCDALSGGFATKSMATRVERYQHYRMRLLFGDKAKRVRACPVINFLIPKEVFDDAGGFANELDFVLEDWEFCHRLRAKGYCIRYDPSVKVTHAYQTDWPLIRRRLMDTAAGGIRLCRMTGASPHLMMMRSKLKWLSSPVWILWHYPLALYGMSVRVETAFFIARLRAYIRMLVGKA